MKLFSAISEFINSEIALNNFKKAKGLLIYDIESDPDIKHDFLHGFIRLPNNIYNEINFKNIKYSPLLNLEKDTESYLQVTFSILFKIK